VQSLDLCHVRLSALYDLSKIAFTNTTDDGCQVISAELKQLDDDYSDLKLSTKAVKENVEKELQDWVELRKKAESLNTWIRDTELKLGATQEYGGDLVEKKLLLEQIKVLKHIVFYFC